MIVYMDKAGDNSPWNEQYQYGTIGACPVMMQANQPQGTASYIDCSLMADGSFVCNNKGNDWIKQVTMAGNCNIPKAKTDDRTFYACTSQADGTFLCGKTNYSTSGIDYVSKCAIGGPIMPPPPPGSVTTGRWSAA